MVPRGIVAFFLALSDLLTSHDSNYGRKIAATVHLFQELKMELLEVVEGNRVVPYPRVDKSVTLDGDVEGWAISDGAYLLQVYGDDSISWYVYDEGEIQRLAEHSGEIRRTIVAQDPLHRERFAVNVTFIAHVMNVESLPNIITVYKVGREWKYDQLTIALPVPGFRKDPSPGYPYAYPYASGYNGQIIFAADGGEMLWTTDREVLPRPLLTLDSELPIYTIPAGARPLIYKGDDIYWQYGDGLYHANMEDGTVIRLSLPSILGDVYTRSVVTQPTACGEAESTLIEMAVAHEDRISVVSIYYSCPVSMAEIEIKEYKSPRAFDVTTLSLNATTIAVNTADGGYTIDRETGETRDYSGNIILGTGTYTTIAQSMAESGPNLASLIGFYY